MSTTSPDSQPRKRARTASRDEDQCCDPREDEEFWLHDGTVVLLAGQTKFRVYLGVLTEHSSVFVEMMSLPQPVDFQGVQYSCPVIRLHDNPDDLRRVFRLLMPRKTSNLGCDSAPTFETVSAYIRIAHKYQMDALLSQWLEYLKKHFTHRFDDWISNKNRVPDGFEPIHAVGVVNLARLTGCNSILPTALAVCTTLGRNIITGFTRADGTREQLSMADLARCFYARGLLIQANATALTLTLSAESTFDACTNDSGVCSEKVRSFLQEGISMYEVTFLAPEGLVPAWKTYEATLARDYGVCCCCLETMQKGYYEAQRVAWWRLPEYTGVEVTPTDWGR
ncbi:hypothetical protein K466DRAFT_666796 [Polyporus arcularius HHB13444]|uniref:BTB domain-containing protein n=1 Tax=Polyporus arcularius HHB13444 TaxID=1314778 RepID=A0A5C3NY16_9APHY|nr:hypothetical protein K466DRAFT_666796 [Polyporus arcularius HHB13444]